MPIVNCRFCGGGGRGGRPVPERKNADRFSQPTGDGWRCGSRDFIVFSETGLEGACEAAGEGTRIPWCCRRATQLVRCGSYAGRMVEAAGIEPASETARREKRLRAFPILRSQRTPIEPAKTGPTQPDWFSALSSGPKLYANLVI
jgi:hypothetical protein